ncbi:hypothetical protein [Companilactobacillus furfuricola]|uniref:hypothetical protein n=1 Tax=Companilactobacillus furfuricola TaxID=1462575 RepID=UPI000F7AEDAD|nr:hypothetical protein [Companilactobacillus furfuricola]
MKKIKYFLILLIPIFFMVLSGCSKLSLTTTKDQYQASGLVAVIKGKATKATKLVYTLNGQKHNIKMHNHEFALSIPVSDRNQDVKIVASDGNESATKIVTIKKAKRLADYTQFAQMYNYFTLLAGQPTDQIPLVAQNGIFNYKKNENTILHFNVQNSALMGIAIQDSLTSFKTKDGIKSFGQTLYSISNLTEANGKKVMSNLQKQLKNAKDGNKTNLKPIKSHGVKFDINLSSEDFYVYVTKE